MSVTATRSPLVRVSTSLLTLLLPAIAVVLAVAGPAAGAAENPPQLLAGVTITGAVVRTPGQPTRNMDANQATAFMQMWLPDSVYEKLPAARPPAGLPITHLDISSTWNGATDPIVVLYASDGAHAWVGMPPQNLGWAVVGSEKWIQAKQEAKLIQAFAGKLSPVTTPTSPTTAASSTPSTKAPTGSAAAPASHDSRLVLPVGGRRHRRRGPGHRCGRGRGRAPGARPSPAS